MLTTAANIIKWVNSIRFFRRDSLLESPWQIIWWWELRRAVFNIIVGITGIVSGMICIGILALDEFVFKLQTEMPDPFFAIAAAIAYGILANAFYTCGWLAELIALRVWKEKAAHFSEIAFSLGITFSVFLTLSPIPILILQMLRIIIFGRSPAE